MNTYSNKGFTLIELLVVVAIIGILASVVIGSLNTARGRSQDAAVKAEASTLKNQSEIFYSGNNFYSSVALTACPTGAAASPTNFFAEAAGYSALASIITKSSDVACNATAGVTGTWSFAVKLPSKGKVWCVDSTGASKEHPSATTAAGAITGGVCA